MQLKDYQTKAIRELLEKSKDSLARASAQKIIFKAPTGSGKTIMTAEFLKRLVDDQTTKMSLAFIWTAPRKLHAQSKQKLEKYYEDSRALACSDFEDLNDRQIGENGILFLNWESINKRDKSTIVRENERDFYLGKIIANTKAAGRTIVLIIDESHHHATSDISQGLIRDIAPKLTIGVSATPDLKDSDAMVAVQLEDVKREGMIKESVILNPDFDNLLDGDNLKTELADGADAMVLDQAVKKRNELAQAYAESGADVNPLLLIQLPDRKTQQEDLIKEEIVSLLKDKHGVTVENGRLAIYLSEEKENLADIARHNHKAEVLIFKHAIALGWDCPRAQVLALFRDWKNLTFSVQTVGRIMRMPQPEVGHYEREILNHCYVFTNIAQIEIREDIARDYATIYASKRIDAYQPLKLDTVYRLRRRERTRLSRRFINTFLSEAQKYEFGGKKGLENIISTKNQSVEAALISDFEAADVDKLTDTAIEGKSKVGYFTDTDLQKLYDFFARSNLSPFYPEDASIGRVKDAIYRFFGARLSMPHATRLQGIINIVLSAANRKHFANVIDAAKETYKAETEKLADELATKRGWELPITLNYNGNYTKVETAKSAMKPFYSDNRWKTETAFINALDRKDSNVEWWFKNGDRDATFFAVEYEEGDAKKPFYIDFIVKFKDGAIGLFDTKSGITIKDAPAKSDGLQRYVSAREGVIGGIVANTNSKDFSGRWMYYTGKSADLVPGNFSNWELLEL